MSERANEKEAIELTADEQKVLLALSYGSDEYCYNFHGIESSTGLSRADVKAACHSLRAKGLARFVRGLMDWDDGRVAGSGYGCTDEGLAFVKMLDSDAIAETMP